MYVIQISGRDVEGYEYKEYFKSVYADDYGIVKIETVSNPLGAKTFVIVEPENKKSILTLVKNVKKDCRIEVKKLNYTLE